MRRGVRSIAGWLVLGGALAATRVAQADPLGTYQSNWEAMLGVRTAYITSAGFDPYADNNALTQFTIGGGRTLIARDRFSLALIGYWDYGARQSSARGDPTELQVHRFAVGPEIRYHFLPELYAFARTAPALLYTTAQLQDSTSEVTLYSRSWVAGFDATGGAAYQLWGPARPNSHDPRFWLVAEGGYGWASATDINLSPDSGDAAAPQRVAALGLPTLVLRGAMFRLAAMATF